MGHFDGVMSDTQFSSLSPNSSNDLEVGNYYVEEVDYFDQETLSIASDKSVANLNDFEDVGTFKIKVDPFLSDFMKEENDDSYRHPWMETHSDSYDMNVFLNSLDTTTDLEDFLSVGTAGLEEVTTDLLDWGDSPPAPISALRTFSNKRALSPSDDHQDLLYVPVASKHRRVEVSSHSRCDEWINKYHELPDRFSFKASGTVDRRKTKHHKVLREAEPDLQVENIDSKRNKMSIYLQKKPSLFPNTPTKLPSQKTNAPLSISSFPHKLETIRHLNLNRSVIRKPFNNHNHLDTLSTAESQPDSYDSRISSTYPQMNTNHNSLSKEVSDIVDIPRIPPPLRMGKRVGRRGHRLSLWQFLMCLLDSSKYREHSTGIKWINRSNGIFHIIDSKQVATLWGQYKERREKMTYDSLARSLRHYYKKNLMAKINNRRLVYQIAQECIQWSAETFLKRTRE